MTPAGNLERALTRGNFAVTAECGPPRGADPDVIRKKGGILNGYVDAVNVTDNQTAVVRMSSMASCLILKEMGLDPVLQMTVRDRNRIALQSDVLGAAALGIRNILCLTGDHQSFGDHPGAKNVHDIDSVQLIDTLRIMRDEGKFLSSQEIKGRPDVFIGCVENPFADPFEIRALRLAKKVRAGAQFVQTQCVFNIDKFTRWMEMVRDLGIHEKAFILAGITPMKSPGMARYMKDSVPGMDVPDPLIQRIESVPKDRYRDEGVAICLETIDAVRSIEGVAGIHIMAIEWEDIVPEIVKKANLFPRPELK
ncbi:MAG: methylenetetrahydrofolate reductase [Deltaproteobacteria bacterium]|nr:methylenetetrahydrofolate reductase [Deltaproteobacteria bacterium]